MKYPVIKNISDILPYVESSKEVIKLSKEGYIVLTYTHQSPETFDISDDVAMHYKRECRGIIFDEKTGDILSRPFHKFFNLGEKCDGEIDKYISGAYLPTLKLDGSMIRPFMIDGNLRLGTKAGVTEVSMASEEILAVDTGLREYCLWELENGYTPIFEYTAPTNRIVLEYDKPELTLLAVRSMETGEYIPHNKLHERVASYGVNVVTLHTLKTTEDLVALRDNKDIEGVVVQTVDGEWCKIKTIDYVQRHAYHSIYDNPYKLADIYFNFDEYDDTISLLTADDKKELAKTISEIADKYNTAIDGIMTDAMRLRVRVENREFDEDRAGLYKIVSTTFPTVAVRHVMRYLTSEYDLQEALYEQSREAVRNKKSYTNRYLPLVAPKGNKNCVVLMGLPCSGKSTYTKELGLPVVSSDAVIERMAELYDRTYDEAWKEVGSTAGDVFFEELHAICSTGKDFCVDRTNLTKKARRRILDILDEYGYNAQLVEFVSNTEEAINICKERAKIRSAEIGKTVPEHVFNKMIGFYMSPTEKEGFTEITKIEVK